MAITLDLTLWKILKYLILYILPLLISAGIPSFILYKRFKKIDSAFEKKLFIHKAQFEKEFSLYSILWEELLILEKHLLDIHGSFSTDEKYSTNKSKENLIFTIQKFPETCTIFYNFIEKYSPFYVKEVYKKFYEILDLFDNIREASLSITDALLKKKEVVNPLTINILDDIINSFFEKKKETSLEISKRIENLKVID